MSNEKKQNIKYGAKRIGKRYGYILVGIPVGWAMCRHYVEIHGAVFPNVSFITYLFNLVSMLHIVDLINSLGGITAVVGGLVAIITTVYRIKKDKKGKSQ